MIKGSGVQGGTAGDEDGEVGEVGSAIRHPWMMKRFQFPPIGWKQETVTVSTVVGENGLETDWKRTGVFRFKSGSGVETERKRGGNVDASKSETDGVKNHERFQCGGGWSNQGKG